MAVGGEPVIVQITAYGEMEYLDKAGRVVQRDSPSSLRESYRRFCVENGLQPLDLGG